MKNKYIGFTVRQVLEDIKQKGVYDSIRMGAEGGNGFIYCGSIDEDAILKEADKARAQTVETISKNLDQFRSVSSGLAEMTTKKTFSKLKDMVFAPLSEEEENEKKENGEEKILALCSTDFKKTHSQTLLPMIDHICEQTDSKAEDFDAVAVAAGPGSFTGLRIGSATAKAIAMAADVLQKHRRKENGNHHFQRIRRGRLLGLQRIQESAEQKSTFRQMA